MKTILTASALALVSNVAVGAWEDVYQNPDLDPRYGTAYNQQFAPATPSGIEVTSLDRFNRGNADTYSGRIGGESHATEMNPADGVAHSLDRFNEGNPDYHPG